MKFVKGGVTAPKGFLANGINCGLKKRKPDLALIYSPTPCRAAGVFTTNRVQAAPVVISRRYLRGGEAQAIIANSGCANCCTGRKGEKVALRTVRAAAKTLGIAENKILIASTGKIGPQLEAGKIIRALPRLISGLNRKKGNACARAIMTTDTVTKEAAVRFGTAGVTVTVGGIAKGAGMISPSLATMLVFLTTDAAITPAALKAALADSVSRSFNRITVDGDMSTNDTVLIMANGRAGNRLISKGSVDFRRFVRALERVTLALAKMIVKDGEGATKFIEVEVNGARSFAEADRVARRIAGSSLVKTAVFGGEPNWGRVAASAGAAGVDFKAEDLKIYFGKQLLLKKGTAVKIGSRSLCRTTRGRKVRLIVNLGRGRASATVWTCDLSPEYVLINAKYN